MPACLLARLLHIPPLGRYCNHSIGEWHLQSVTGVAPNCIFNVEWRAAYYPGNGVANYEVRLYEGQLQFDIVYGQIDQSGFSATVGVDQRYRGLSTQYECSQGGLSAHLLLTFTQPACTPTPTVTGTPPTATETFTPSPSATCGGDAPWIAASPVPTGVGRYAYAQNGSDFYIMGGFTDFGITNRTFKYDANTGGWSELASMPYYLADVSATFYNGRIYVAGGYNGSGSTSVFQIYDVASNTWTFGASLPATLDGTAAGAYGGQVYVVGGEDQGVPSTAIWIYDIATDSWSSGPSLFAPFWYGGFAQVGQYLYLVGSYNSSLSGPERAKLASAVQDPRNRTTESVGNNSTVTQRLDLEGGGLSVGPIWTQARADMAVVYDGSKLYALGGLNNDFTLSSQVDELSLDSWPGGVWVHSPSDLPSPREANEAGFFSTARTGGEIWSTGGLMYGGNSLSAHIFRSILPCGTITPTPTGTLPTATNTLSPQSPARPPLRPAQ